MTIFLNLNKTKKRKILFSKPGKYVTYMYNLSGDFLFDIRSKNVNLDIYGLYVGQGSDQFRVNTVQRHAAPGATSNLFIKGVFDDEAKFIHHGLVKIDREGQKSKAYQKNQNLILSKGAYVESKPDLEILANDVFCTHGSTTGKLSEDQIYYLNSRGINRGQATKVLVEGFINDIKDRVRDYL